MSCDTYEVMGDNNVLYEITWLSIRSDELEYILERRDPE